MKCYPFTPERTSRGVTAVAVPAEHDLRVGERIVVVEHNTTAAVYATVISTRRCAVAVAVDWSSSVPLGALAERAE